ncbi:MAG: 50S ribosome-binding GTPase [Candidatus Poseidoniia archaeon]|nr:50S ribosome-binding GTPase [Candidatus Poseidoniia archaeon]
MSLTDRIAEIEEEISSTKYNKVTQHHIGKLKAKLAQLREQVVAQSSGPKGSGYGVRKAGDATVAIVGLPSVGKSTLLNSVTAAESETAAYAFTTLDVIPGVLQYRQARIQMLDLPGLIAGAARGAGRGREVLSVIRAADLVLHLVDASEPASRVILQELEDAGLRLDGRRPNGAIARTSRGGIEIISTVSQELEEEAIKAVAREYGVVNAQIVLREQFNLDLLVDLLAGTRVYPPSLTVLTKIDLASKTQLAQARELCPNAIEIAPPTGQGLDALRDAIYERLDFISVFMKPQGQSADLEEPLVVRRGTTVTEICNALHRDFLRKFRYALVWGDSAKFPGQTVGLAHVVADSDLVSIITHR